MPEDRTDADRSEIRPGLTLTVIIVIVALVVVLVLGSCGAVYLRRRMRIRVVKAPRNSTDAAATKAEDIQRDGLPSCYLGGGESEWGEREIAKRHTAKCDRVLELGGGAGSVSAVVQSKLKDPSKHVVVQPDERKPMMGGYRQLEANRKSCGFDFTTIDHMLTKDDVPFIVEKLNGKPDCLIADCEDCLGSEFEKNPELFDEVKMIQVERDDVDGNYESLFKEFTKTDSYYGCGVTQPTADHIRNGMLCTTEVWEKNEEAPQAP